MRDVGRTREKLVNHEPKNVVFFNHYPGLLLSYPSASRYDQKQKSVAGKRHQDSEFFHKTFPFFIWLLRDVAQEIPRDCRNIKDYFLKKVNLYLIGNS